MLSNKKQRSVTYYFSLFRGQTLRAVTEGKIHVELERARLTRQLAKIRESEGKVAEAADLMAEVQVCIYT